MELNSNTGAIITALSLLPYEIKHILSIPSEDPHLEPILVIDTSDQVRIGLSSLILRAMSFLIKPLQNKH